MRKVAEVMRKVAEVMRKVAEVMRKIAEVMRRIAEVMRKISEDNLTRFILYFLTLGWVLFMKIMKSNQTFYFNNHATSQPKHVKGERMTTPEKYDCLSLGWNANSLESAHPRAP